MSDNNRERIIEFFLEHSVFGTRVRFLVLPTKARLDAYASRSYGICLKPTQVGATFYRSVPSERIVGESAVAEEALTIESLSHEIDHAVILMYRWQNHSFNLGSEVSSLEEEVVRIKGELLKQSLEYLISQGYRVNGINIEPPISVIKVRHT